MQLEDKRTLIVLVYWGALSFLSGWIAKDSTLTEILGLSVLYALGFLASYESLKTRTAESKE